MGRVLVVDDEQSMREFLAICLRRAGHEVSVADSGAAAVGYLDKQPVDVVVTDLRMPGELDGLGLLDQVKHRGIDVEVILVTAFATADTAIAAMKRGAYDYLTKPFKVDEINAVIGRAMEKRKLVAENLALRERVAGRVRLAQLLGRSRAMQKVFELIGKIHSTKTSVLITGESGTGKELVARALHTEGSRSTGPFVAVNCGAIPEELMESELFGHVKGSFTGAHVDKTGLFRQAQAGTLFLDEIASCRSACRSSSCARCRSAGSSRSAPPPSSTSTSASSPRPTAISRPRSPAARSAATCTTGSTSSRCGCRRCGSAARTCRCSPSTSRGASPPIRTSRCAPSSRRR